MGMGHSSAAIHLAATTGDVSGLRRCLSKGKILARQRLRDSKDADGLTPLHICSKMGSVEGVEALLDAGADHMARNGEGWTPLMVASRWGHLDVIDKLLAVGTDVNASGNCGRGALHWASCWGQREAVRRLIAAGADVNKVDGSGWTPLHVAASVLDYTCLEILLREGAWVAAVDCDGFKAIDKLIAHGEKAAACRELLTNTEIQQQQLFLEKQEVTEDGVHEKAVSEPDVAVGLSQNVCNFFRRLSHSSQCQRTAVLGGRSHPDSALEGVEKKKHPALLGSGKVAADCLPASLNGAPLKAPRKLAPLQLRCYLPSDPTPISSPSDDLPNP
jgi:ankyrin repeat protein